MKRLIYLSAACLSLGGSVGILRFAGSEEERTLVALEPVRECGQLHQGDAVDLTYELVNRSSDAVTIQYVTETCTCTKARLPKKQLAPGEKTSLGVQWDVSRRRGRTAEEIAVVFRVGEGPTERLELKMRATVVPDIDRLPDRLIFAEGARAEKCVEFRPRAGRDCTVQKVYTTHRAFRAVLAPDGKSAKVSFDPGLWAGDPAEAQLVAETTSAHEREVRIPLVVGSES